MIPNAIIRVEAKWQTTSRVALSRARAEPMLSATGTVHPRKRIFGNEAAHHAAGAAAPVVGRGTHPGSPTLSDF